MKYHIDDERISLNDLRKRIEQTDLVPSRGSLLEAIQAKMNALEQQGVSTLAGLRRELKNSKHLEALSKATGIDAQYLILLRREIESYFPKPFALKVFDWLPDGEIAKLEKMGIKHTAALYEKAGSVESRTELAKLTGMDAAILEELYRLADLTRGQWVSPKFARMLVETGYDSVSKLTAADAEQLCEALVLINEGDRFFKGKIGLRDIIRLVRSVCYLSD